MKDFTVIFLVALIGTPIFTSVFFGGVFIAREFKDNWQMESDTPIEPTLIIASKGGISDTTYVYQFKTALK